MVLDITDQIDLFYGFEATKTNLEMFAAALLEERAALE